MTADLSRVPLATPDLRGREAEYLAECVRDNWVSSAGPAIPRFEAMVAERVGRRFGVATMSGTTALQLAMVGLGLPKGSRVIVPAWTFAASANAVSHAGCQPFLVDVTRDSWSLDPDLVNEVLARGDSGVSAVIAVDPLGHPADMDALIEICARHKVPLIEDAAGSLGASYRGRPCGSFGAAAMLSFNGNKIVTSGAGGMVVTDDETLAKTLRSLSAQARKGDRYEHDSVGFNYRMANINAAVGIAQMERLDEMVAARRRIAAAYDRVLSGRADILAMPRLGWADSSCWLYSVLCGSEQDADALVRAMTSAAIEARVFWRTLADQTPWRDAPRHLSGVAAALTGTVVSLPCSSHLTEQQQARVVKVLNEFTGQSEVSANWRQNATGEAA